MTIPTVPAVKTTDVPSIIDRNMFPVARRKSERNSASTFMTWGSYCKKNGLKFETKADAKAAQKLFMAEKIDARRQVKAMAVSIISDRAGDDVRVELWKDSQGRRHVGVECREVIEKSDAEKVIDALLRIGYSEAEAKAIVAKNAKPASN